jgi:hypothetical protein
MFDPPALLELWNDDYPVEYDLFKWDEAYFILNTLNISPRGYAHTVCGCKR